MIALVTGVSGGIGGAIATRLIADGWEVHGTYFNHAAEAEALADGLASLTLHRVDLSAEADVERLVAEMSHVALGGLVNNAGIIAFEDLQSFDMNIWRRTFEVNLMAPVRLARALEGQLAGGGAVVNIASTDGHVGSYNSGAYAASKAALLNATQSLSNLLARSQIRVNAVTPGWIDTDTTLESELAAQLTPLGRLGQPSEVADAVAWLLGSASAFVTGASVVIDGGYGNVDYVIRKEAGL